MCLPDAWDFGQNVNFWLSSYGKGPGVYFSYCLSGEVSAVVLEHTEGRRYLDSSGVSLFSVDKT